MREFECGATRDNDDGKLDYIQALSPRVLTRYLAHMGKHRTQADGSRRGWGNWKAGMPVEVYWSSLGRHFIEAWTSFEDGDEGAAEEALCAMLFNTFGLIHELTRQ